jgi:hypothetical protein
VLNTWRETLLLAGRRALGRPWNPFNIDKRGYPSVIRKGTHRIEAQAKIILVRIVDNGNLVRLPDEGRGGPIQMQYLLLIYDQESQWGKLSEAEQGKMYKEYGNFTESITKSGHYIGGNQLHPVAKATTVRVRDGKKLITDGPFAETKEQLGGYYMIEAGNLDDALAIASRIPSARFGSIEVRPIVPRGEKP